MFGRRSHPLAWIIAGMVPGVMGAPRAGVLAWAAVLLVGAVAPRGGRLVWVALAWIGSVVVPGTPLLATAATGTMLHNGRLCLAAATLGAAIGLVGLPPLALRAGVLLLGGGILAAVLSRPE